MHDEPSPTPRWQKVIMTWVLPVVFVTGGVGLHWATQVPRGPMEPRPKPKPKKPRVKKRPKAHRRHRTVKPAQPGAPIGEKSKAPGDLRRGFRRSDAQPAGPAADGKPSPSPAPALPAQAK